MSKEQTINLIIDNARQLSCKQILTLLIKGGFSEQELLNDFKITEEELKQASAEV